MRQSVIDAWHAFSEPFEGRVYHMYLDCLGLVTTGVGNLIDAIHVAQRWPWKRPDGTLATPAEVAAEWRTIKARQDLAKRHYKYAGQFCKLRITDADIDNYVAAERERYETTLRKYYPKWDQFPADAQLGIMSMAWAMGPAFPKKFVNFSRAVNKGDWRTAAASCTIREAGNPGVVPRNRANRLCFANAAVVSERDWDRDALHWPHDAANRSPAAEARRPQPQPIRYAELRDRAAEIEERDEVVRGGS